MASDLVVAGRMIDAQTVQPSDLQYAAAPIFSAGFSNSCVDSGVRVERSSTGSQHTWLLPSVRGSPC